MLETWSYWKQFARQVWWRGKNSALDWLPGNLHVFSFTVSNMLEVSFPHLSFSFCPTFPSSLFWNSWILHSLRINASNSLPQILFSFLSIPFLFLRFQMEKFSYSFLRFIPDLLPWYNPLLHSPCRILFHCLLIPSLLSRCPQPLLHIDSFSPDTNSLNCLTLTLTQLENPSFTSISLSKYSPILSYFHSCI